MALVRVVGSVGIVGILAGCAFTPDVTATYFFPKAETQIAITQTIACVPGDGVRAEAISAVETVTPNTTYSSDRRQPKGKLKYADLDGAFSDTDLSLSFTDDGRLAGVNASSTGEGETIIKNAAAFAATVAPAFIGATAAVGNNPPPPPSPDCQAIQKYSTGDPTKSATVTVNYALSILYDESAQNGRLRIEADPVNSIVVEKGPRSLLTISPAEESQPIAIALKKDLPGLFHFVVKINKTSHAADAASWNDDGTSSSNVSLELNRVDVVDLEVDGFDQNNSRSITIWKGQVPVPTSNHYILPIPKPAIFGKQQFTLSLSNYGSISKLDYGKNTGATDATAAAGVLAKALKGPSEATQAAMIQAQSDLIYQQQRLALCKASPTACSGK